MGDDGPAFGRLLAALPTPLDERGRLDGPALDHLVGYFTERHFDGLAVLTEVGEHAFLDPEEQRAVVERVAQKADGRAPFWIQISHAATRPAVEAARAAEEAGAAGLFLALPPLPGIGYPEVYRHVDRVANATSRQLVLVVRPGDLVFGLAPEEQATLVKHPRLSGVWVIEGGTSAPKSWARRIEPERGGVLSPCSFELLETAKSGAVGVVCALAVLAPGPARAMVDAVKGGDLDVLRRVHRRMKPAVERLGPPRPLESQGSVERWAERIARRPLDGGRARPFAPPQLIKEGLRLQGHRIKAFVRPPQPQITPEDSGRLKTLMKSCGMLG